VRGIAVIADRSCRKQGGCIRYANLLVFEILDR
jgi:hypothetical protein